MPAVGHILPIALAVAISSVPITATIIILLSPTRSRSAAPFLIGWALGLFVAVALATLAAQAIPLGQTRRQADTTLGIIAIIVGACMIVLAVTSWKRAVTRQRELPTWLSTIGSLGPWQSFAVGMVLNMRPKGLLLAVAAGLTIRADAEEMRDAILAIVVYTIIGASTVAVPTIATLAAPTRMEPRLVRAREWLDAHGQAVTNVILLFIGVVVAGAGYARL